MFDFHIDRVVPDDELGAALSRVFDAPSIRLITELESPDDFNDVELLGVRWVNDGDFPLHVSIYPQKNVFEREPALAQKLCAALETRCLISDDSYNPCSWILVDAMNTKNVLLDANRFDHDEMVLSAATGASSSSS